MTRKNKSVPLLNDEDILPHLKFIRSKKQEYFVCLSLDSKHRLITRRVVTIGLLDATLIHPREVFAGPLKDRAASIIVAHNHPSGDPEPSWQDIEATEQLMAAGELLGISVKNHVIVAKHNHFTLGAKSTHI
jgi:DNA repair protein RadC